MVQKNIRVKQLRKQPTHTIIVDDLNGAIRQICKDVTVKRSRCGEELFARQVSRFVRYNGTNLIQYNYYYTIEA